LSSGHAALALYVVLEKYEFTDAEMLFKKHGGHPHRDEENGIFCSTGSLGMGITVAIGRALADPDRIVHCLISDGECAEGSVWESLKFIYENNLKNIKIYVNINGYAAYDSVDVRYLATRLKTFLPEINLIYTDVNQFSFLRGLNAHYHVMDKGDYESAKKELEGKNATD
jgi:transketolase N-terminal domain/subunit